jgi:hypothetical protein
MDETDKKIMLSNNLKTRKNSMRIMIFLNHLHCLDAAFLHFNEVKVVLTYLRVVLYLISMFVLTRCFSHNKLHHRNRPIKEKHSVGFQSVDNKCWDSEYV